MAPFRINTSSPGCTKIVLFSIVNSERDGEDFFGDTAKLFEAIDEDEFKSKLEESIDQISEMFDASNVQGINTENLPNPEDLHSHISGLLGGNLGKLAREIAEETVNEFVTPPLSTCLLYTSDAADE